MPLKNAVRPPAVPLRLLPSVVSESDRSCSTPQVPRVGRCPPLERAIGRELVADGLGVRRR
eukprot:scaffold768_cov382-Prasinococcus_capsulatus_cf.AAC.4